MKSVDMATWAASQGWTVVKIVPGTKKAAEKWRDLGYRDPSEVRRAWGRREYSVGILTGPSRLVCDDLDVDDEGNPAGDWALADLATDAGKAIPRTFTLATPSGGTHLIWAQPNGRDYRTCAGKVGDHIDVRGQGGLFVLYDPTRSNRVITDARPPTPMPRWLSELHPEPGSSFNGRVEFSVPNTSAWVEEVGQGEPCQMMQETCEKWLGRFEDGVPHDVMIEAVNALVGDAVAGHRGLKISLLNIRSVYFAAMRGKTREREKGEEWTNAVNGAIDKKLGRRGGVVADDDPCEVELETISVGKAIGGVYVDDIEERHVEWLSKPWLPFGSLVIIDGDPGQGKSIITNVIVSNASAGCDILPESSKNYGQPIRCGMVIAEDDDSIVRGRLAAAGYGFDKSIMIMNTKHRGKYLKFPDGVNRVRDFIVKNGLLLLIIDPISQYIGEKIVTHNDASVRDALGPLAEIAKNTGCCILLVRHLNKSGQMKAMYRGGGSIAFSALARSGMITGVLPDGKFGLAQTKCSYARPFEGTLSYSVDEWDEDEEIPVIRWGGAVEVDADSLAKGERRKSGLESPSQDAIRVVLEELFETKDAWPQKEVAQQLKDAGCTTEHKTVNKVRSDMGIVSRPIRKGSKFIGWEWTIEKQSTTRSLPRVVSGKGGASGKAGTPFDGTEEE